MAKKHRSLRDRFVALLARALTRPFFRSVELEGTLPTGGPVILAASHLNGFVDPVVMVARLRTLPRFLAKATLWDVVVSRPLLWFVRAIPVHRRQDEAGNVDNAATFSSAVEALAEGGLLAVFPEGTTHDDPTLRPLRTGVARIALQAAASGVEGVRIIPVGVSYEDKVAVRGRALVSFGPAIEVPTGDDLVDEDGVPTPELVRELTGELQLALQALTPHFDTTEEMLALASAAQITLRDTKVGAPPVPMARVAAAARKLAGAGEEQVQSLVSLVARYQMLLRFVKLDDDEVVGTGLLTRLARRLVVLAILIVVLLPVAIAGLFANLIPVVLVLIAGLIPRAPVSKGTIRVLVALVAFPVTWVVLALRDGDSNWLGDIDRAVTYPVDGVLGSGIGDRGGVLAGVVVLVAIPLFGAVALILAERLWAMFHGLQSWRTLVDRRGQLGEIRERRAEVVAATNAILKAPAVPTTPLLPEPVLPPVSAE